MDDAVLFSNLYTILTNNRFNSQFIYFCCGLYNNINLYSEFQTKGAYYVIGKLLCVAKNEMINYINYLLIIIQDKDSVMKLQIDVLTIDNFHIVLNSQNRNNFLLYLYGIYSQEDWCEIEKYGDSFIIGRILDIQEPKIYIGCKFMLIQNGDIHDNIANGDDAHGDDAAIIHENI
jgi:hypothetical protein